MRAKALWRTSGAQCWQQSRKSGSELVCATRDSMEDPRPSAMPEIRSSEHTMRSFSVPSSRPARCLLSAMSIRRVHRANTGGAYCANPWPRAMTTEERHSRRGESDRSSSAMLSHFPISGGISTARYSGRLSSEPTTSARVPHASYMMIKFRCWYVWSAWAKHWRTAGMKGAISRCPASSIVAMAEQAASWTFLFPSTQHLRIPITNGSSIAAGCCSQTHSE
mmetsp:Transcript_25135/g.59957  ORF Transcript_25135/g.59957 Transcript_25135/m.59957 type:complete len:222 (-) Transcript_25135:1465-2130(-)